MNNAFILLGAIMKVTLSFAIALCAAFGFSAFAFGDNAPMELSGTWTIDSGHGPSPTCRFEQAANNITGSCAGPNANGTIKGRIVGQRVHWRWEWISYAGKSGAFDFKGTLKAAHTIVGMLERREIGLSLNFTAEQQPANSHLIQTSDRPLRVPARDGAYPEGTLRTEVPIHQTVLSDGTLRYSVPIRIGNSAPIEAMLDTGSIGLRILPGAISSTNYEITLRPNIYGYGSGVKIEGLIANANVSIGGATTDAPIPIQVIQRVGCFRAKPRCPASRVMQAAYGLGGDGLPNEGFKAILGIDMPLRGASYEVVNPLLHFGRQTWMIMLPRPGQSRPGRLIINPNATDLSGSTSFTDLVRMPLFRREVLAGCLHNQNSGRTFCGPVLFDTGAPGVVINTSSVTPRVWGQGMRGLFSFGNANGWMPYKVDFAANRDHPGFGVRVAQQHGPRPTIMSAGIIPFLAFAVHYDARNHEIGLKPRSLPRSITELHAEISSVNMSGTR